MIALGRHRGVATILGLQIALTASCGWSPKWVLDPDLTGALLYAVNPPSGPTEWRVRAFGDRAADQRVVLPFHPFLDPAAWSSDGTQVAYFGKDGLYVARADGSNPRLVPTKTFLYPFSGASWSPDGTHIAAFHFVGPSGATAPLIVDVTTGSVHYLTGIKGFWDLIAWSPDGERLAIAGVDLRTHNTGVMEVSLDVSLVRQMYSGDRVDALQWSPDGRRILVAIEGPSPEEGLRVCTTSGWDIVAVPVDGSEATRVTTWPGWDGSPVLSPDGEWVAFVADRPVEWTPNTTCQPTDPLPELGSPEYGAVWLTHPDGTATHIAFQAGAGESVTPFAWFADPSALEQAYAP